VMFPAIPIDSLMNFYMLCQALNAELFLSPGQVVSHEIGYQALQLLWELVQKCSPACRSHNPITVYETMSTTNEIVYCPFAYGYSNYARAGYSRRSLTFGDLVTFHQGEPLRTTLGGTGLAVSARTKRAEEAFAFARFVADPSCQRGLYALNGGQPGHRSAWLDDELNRLTQGFFKDTLSTLDRAYLRPRYDGYLEFQDRAGHVVCDFIHRGGDPATTLTQLDQIYQQSRRS
jgi:multiple sugar transport system substrate-binding protein